ncbi:MAG: homoaconitase [Acidobacteriia bacterium]|nr:homoaconitase [Terriglobia bacterium]
MGQTITEKIAQAHLAEGPKRPLRAGDYVSIRPKHVMTHDNTSAVMKKFKSIGAAKIQDTRQPVFALDHDIQNQNEDNLKKYRAIEAFAGEHGIDFYPAGTGIGHQIMCERGYVTPGSFVVASDSHSNMYGALGAVGTPVVRTDAAAIWATGEFWWQIPRTVQVVLEGALKPGVTGKDVIIALCGAFNVHVLNAAVEFAGPGVASLSMDARMTMANMSTEWGALVGWFPVDETTIKWLRERREERNKRGEPERCADEELRRWAEETREGAVLNTPTLPAPNPGADKGGATSLRSVLLPDPDADYAARITLDLSHLTPHVSGPDTVQEMTSLVEIEKKKVAIQKAYLLSCVNSRVEDLEEAALVLLGKKVAPSVKFYLGAASKLVQEEAERRGIWRTLVESGANTLPAGCGPCIGLGVGLLEPGEVGISATNRNFKGRMGSRDAQCYLASPAVVAASAVAGYICGPEALKRPPNEREDRKKQGGMLARYKNLQVGRKTEAANETVEIVPGFPERVRGRLVFVPKDNLNTDAIYPGSYTYRDDVTPQMMAEVVFSNYDPQFPQITRAGDVVVGGANFGTGSSREQAATSLKAKGFPLVIAAGFSQTYLRNAFNNGFLCIEIPELVKRLKADFAAQIASGEKTIIPGDEIAIEFTSGVVTWRGDEFRFPTLGSVPQSLVVAGGVENLVVTRLMR